jgi:predicted transcriptional regulator of viral defense system
MKSLKLYTINKLYFGYEDIARILDIGDASAKVTASRYVKQGILIRIKRNMYMMQDVWRRAELEQKFELANLGQTPSYISLMTALAYHEITTQMQRDYFESIALKRTKEINIDDCLFQYVKVNKDLYFGFKKEKNFFIATPEKALVDAFYLMSYGRYTIDISSLSNEKLDGKEVERISNYFPLKTRNILKKYGYPTTA